MCARVFVCVCALERKVRGSHAYGDVAHFVALCLSTSEHQEALGSTSQSVLGEGFSCPLRSMGRLRFRRVNVTV